MPVSKKRKKRGKLVKGGPDKSMRRVDDRPTNLSLQELINVLAFQEAMKPDDDPTKMHNPNMTAEEEAKLREMNLELPTVLDMEDPDTEAVIKAVHEVSQQDKENEDER